MIVMFQDFAKVEMFITPLISLLLEKDNRCAMTIVVLIENKDLPAEDAIVWIHQVNDTDGKTEMVAMAKAKTSWRTGRSTRSVSENAWLLAEAGDCVWPGAIVHDDHDIRVVVAVSGLTSRHDEYLASFTANTIDVISDDNMSEIMKGSGMIE